MNCHSTVALNHPSLTRLGCSPLHTFNAPQQHNSSAYASPLRSDRQRRKPNPCVNLAEAGPANEFAGPILVGDADLNGKVEALDLNPLAIAWQDATEFDWSNGNFTSAGDPGVNVSDLNGLALEWQNEVPLAAAANQAVPEPTTASLILLIFFACAGCRKMVG